MPPALAGVHNGRLAKVPRLWAGHAGQEAGGVFLSVLQERHEGGRRSRSAYRTSPFFSFRQRPTGHWQSGWHHKLFSSHVARPDPIHIQQGATFGNGEGSLAQGANHLVAYTGHRLAVEVGLGERLNHRAPWLVVSPRRMMSIAGRSYRSSSQLSFGFRLERNSS